MNKIAIFSESGQMSTFRLLNTVKMIVITLFALQMINIGVVSAETTWTPSLTLLGIYDDNIQFVREDPDEKVEPEDDYIYRITPLIQIDHRTEVSNFTAKGGVSFRRFADHDDLNDESYDLDVISNSNITERLRFHGDYEFIKDTTLDSELLETGRTTSREDRFSHNIRLAPSYNITERFNMGVSGRYRNVAYDSDEKIDYSVWDINIPLRYAVISELDTIYVSPGYSNRDSDISQSNSYNLRLGWDHKTTERLRLDFSIGARFTEYENLNTGVTDDQWGALGSLKINYDFLTGHLLVDINHDLRNSADGSQVNVTWLITRLRWSFSERTGMELSGRYYYTDNEGTQNDETSHYYVLGSQLFYELTENHQVFIAYEYSNDDLEKEIEDLPQAERNRIWAGVRLSFPIE